MLQHPGSRSPAKKKAASGAKLGIPDCPDFLGEIAREEWNRAIKELRPRKVMTKGDYGALAVYCDAWATMVKASRVLEAEGLTFKTPKGYVQQRPEVSIAHQCRKQVVDFAREYGLTPSSRAKVSGLPSDESGAGDEWDMF